MARKLPEIIELILRHRKELQKEYGVEHLKIFGSYARNEQKENSDLDILVSLNGKIDLLGFVDLKFYLEEITGLPVDLVSDKGMSPFLKPYIEKSTVEVF
jgi:predicted nucleotidyltransferase